MSVDLSTLSLDQKVNTPNLDRDLQFLLHIH